MHYKAIVTNKIPSIYSSKTSSSPVTTRLVYSSSHQFGSHFEAVIGAAGLVTAMYKS
ncbi:hypothetical protein PGT21_002686 [Puccinia graminis f. sp. tritici]|uniref:Uncharacterized protein n=1 Tax=Puccinia graminis f. sp. tritici TaxID=56615 RepID=A0A5B0PKA1_PUCGR|nr:hypothetical protein PGT21_002686 [Puccinia graminis f. sp. tritici]